MSGLTFVLGDLELFALPVERTLVFALWYATLLWLPVRGVAAAIDHFRGVHPHHIPVGAHHSGDAYGIGMEVLPPM